MVCKMSNKAILIIALICLLQPIELFHFVSCLLNESYAIPSLNVGGLYEIVQEGVKRGNWKTFLLENISTGQELLDLQEALDKQIITEQEFDKLREGIINGNQEFVIDIEEFENFDGDTSESVKIRININGDDIELNTEED